MSLATPEKLKSLQRALYSKAKREPQARFHFLYDKVWRSDVLAHAYKSNRANGGAPGVDRQTFAGIDAYGVRRWLAELQEELRSETYKPSPVRRVMIPKPGGVGERPLGIPTIRDRVVQMAVKLVTEPIFEADFDEAAYGYRPRRSAEQAVRRVNEAVWHGHTEVESPTGGPSRRREANSRYIPRAVVREVYRRDAGQCTFVSSKGKRSFLELHHHDWPYAKGGEATVENLRLVCRSHNSFFAERDYGRAFMRSKQKQTRESIDELGPLAVV